MNPLELIAIARALVGGVIAGDAVPVSQTALRRAVSCAYYAMFHTLLGSNADVLVGALPSDRQRWAWRQAYSTVDHRAARNKLSRSGLVNRFPVAISDFGDMFAVAQQARHSADYDPHGVFSATEVTELVDKAEAAILAFNQTPDYIRRELAIHLITSPRGE